MEKAIAALLCFEWGLGFLESGPLFFKHTTRNGGPTQTQIIFAKISDGKFELDVKPVEYVAKHSVVVIPEKNGNNVVLVDSSKLYAALDGFFVDASTLGEMIMWKTEMRFSDASDLFSRDRGVLQEGEAQSES